MRARSSEMRLEAKFGRARLIVNRGFTIESARQIPTTSCMREIRNNVLHRVAAYLSDVVIDKDYTSANANLR